MKAEELKKIRDEQILNEALHDYEIKNMPVMINELWGGLTEEILLKKFGWILDCTISNATLSIKRKKYFWQRDKLIWVTGRFDKGIWKDGIWQYGFWYGGEWKKGTWKNGIWYNGIWHKGTWHTGIWYNGIWKKGTWVRGDWYNGVVHRIKIILSMRTYEGKTIKDYKYKKEK